VSVQIHDGKIEIDGVRELVDKQLKDASEQLAHANLPPAVRAKLQQRLDHVRETVTKRIGSLKITDLDQLGDELGKMGDDIGKEMEQLGKDMEALGPQLGKQLGKDLGKQLKFGGNMTINVGHDDDDDDDNDAIASGWWWDSSDDDDLDDAVRDLGDLNLKSPQREQIAKIRTDSDQQVATAKKALDAASTQLKHQLDNPATSDAELAKSIDAVAQQEAQIRKARILAWHSARRVLDDAQRKKVENAAKKTK